MDQQILPEEPNQRLCYLLQSRQIEPIWDLLRKQGDHLREELVMRALQVIAMLWQESDYNSITLADYIGLIDHLRLSKPQLNYLVGLLVSRDQWDLVAIVCERYSKDLSQGLQQWVMKQATQKANARSVARLMKQKQFQSLLPPSALSCLIRRNQWVNAATLLEQNKVCEADRRWLVLKASRRQPDIFDRFLPYVKSETLELKSLITNLVTHNEWKTVTKIASAHFMPADIKRWVVLEASARAPYLSETGLLDYLEPEYMRDVVIRLKRQMRLGAIRYIVEKKGVANDVLEWIISDAFGMEEEDLRQLLMVCTAHQRMWLLACAVHKGQYPMVTKLLRLCPDFDEALGEVLQSASRTIVLHVHDNSNPVLVRSEQDFSDIFKLLDTLKTLPAVEGTSFILRRFPPIEQTLADHEPVSIKSEAFVVFMTRYSTYRCQTSAKPLSHSLQRVDDQNLLYLLAARPIFYELQHAALFYMLRHKKWDVIARASLHRMREQVRRELFTAAVEQGEWAVVDRWADHSLYDDQQTTAMEKAFQDRQWLTMLRLADLGLTSAELVHVYYRLAKHGGINSVLKLMGQGADLLLLKEMLKTSRANAWNTGELACILKYRKRICKVLKFQQKLLRLQLKQHIPRSNHTYWRIVLQQLKEAGCCDDPVPVLQKAMAAGAWRVVMELVRMGALDLAIREQLFSDMMKGKQWELCRLLLEKGLSIPTCKTALPTLLEARQWVLLARIMEHDVGDAVRREIITEALSCGEGSLVATFLITLQEKASVAEREELFHLCAEDHIWQALKPLVMEADETGQRQRNHAMQLAVQHRQWDVVDHCERHYASVSQQEKDGSCRLINAAFSGEWDTVEQLVRRQVDVSRTDSYGNTVLHLALTTGMEKTAITIMQFFGDVNMSNADGVTPLAIIVDQTQAQLVDELLFWHKDVFTGGVNKRGETLLHAACEAGHILVMDHLVLRGMNPLALTKRGESVLMFAVQNAPNPEHMVAACIRLGTSTHQMAITEALVTWLSNANSATSPTSHGPYNHNDYLKNLRNHNPVGLDLDSTEFDFFTAENFSPFLYAMARDLRQIRDMLYEAGACSYRELFTAYREAENHKTEYPDLAWLKARATTPRSLKSLCRLVISHSLRTWGKRVFLVHQLQLPAALKDHVLFCDLWKDLLEGEQETEGRPAGAVG